MIDATELQARYTKVEREADAFGRIIGVHRLKLSQHVMLEEMAPSGKGSVTLAAMVCEIDQIPIPFPKTRGELNAILDRLDVEGLDAANTAWKRLAGIVDEDEPKGDVIEEAKK